jgi:hypothetical protein
LKRQAPALRQRVRRWIRVGNLLSRPASIGTCEFENRVTSATPVSPRVKCAKPSGGEARERPLWSGGANGPVTTAGNFLNICFLESGIYAMMFGLKDIRPPQLGAAVDALAQK